MTCNKYVSTDSRLKAAAAARPVTALAFVYVLMSQGHVNTFEDAGAVISVYVHQRAHDM